ncbi:hypothetical protein JCM10213_001068 [Rhodosporidiobolus nylandii]
MPASPRRPPPLPISVAAANRTPPSPPASSAGYSQLDDFEMLDEYREIRVGGYARIPARPAAGASGGSSSSADEADDEDDELLPPTPSKQEVEGKRAETRLFLGIPPQSRASTFSTSPSTPLPPYSPPHLNGTSVTGTSSGKGGRRGRWFNTAVGGSGRAERVRVVWLLMGLAAGVLLGYEMGGSGARMQEERESVVPETIPGRCDPYSSSRPGHLVLHPTSYADNGWQPLDDGLPPCDPVNWMDLLRRSGQADTGGLSAEEWRSLEFLRGKSVVAFGDSVDRDQNEHFCEFVGGKFDMIHAYDPLSPPYPEGEERPRGEVYDLEREGNAWPDFGQSRPYKCYVERLNFTTLNVFHYGFTPENDWLRNSPHFYPPSALEARFTSIVLPLVRSLFGDAGPSIFSFAPGFWDIMRQIKKDEEEAQDLAAKGRLTPEKGARLSGWSELSEERRSWFVDEYERMMRRVLSEWGGGKGSTRIVWRALHQPRPFINAPKNRVAVVDQIGRAVVARLLNEDRSTPSSENTPLRERLYVTNWGRMILGQEYLSFRDDIHPNPMPSSWLAWNILLEQVEVQDEVQKRKLGIERCM